MSEARVWGTSEDGKIHYQSLTRDLLNEAMISLRESFFAHENVCKAVGLSNNASAISECDDLVLSIARQGVSVVAIDKDTQKIVGVSLNKIQDKFESSKQFFNDYINLAQFPETIGIFKFLIEIEDGLDPFSLYNVDCLLEVVFLGVSPDYGNKRIGQKLFEISIELAGLLYKGENVKTSLDGTLLPLEPRPQIVSSILTSFKTQKICRRLNFDLVKTMKFKDVYYNGASYASRLGDEDLIFTFECKKLE